MDRLVSKIAAGGLSAGVFLFWWPEHVPGDGLTQLVLRGLLWTLSFELLLLAFGPLEQRAGLHLRRRMDTRRDRVRTRLDAVPVQARTGGVLTLAIVGLAAPLYLLAGAPHQLVKQTEPPRIVKQVIVQRPIVHKKIIVRKIVAPAPTATAGLQSVGAAPSVATSQVTRPAASKATPVTTAEKTTTAKRAVTPAKLPVTKPAARPTGATSTSSAPATAPASGTSSPAPAPATQSAAPAAATPAQP